MAKFKVSVSWTMCAEVEIEAESIDEALFDAQEIPLPENGSYLDGSFTVDHEVTQGLNKEEMSE